MRFWIGAYVVLALFDVVVTYIFVSQERFGVMHEGNPLIRTLMEQYGIWQGLTLYVIQEFVIFFVMWGLFYYVIRHLIKGRSEELHYKIDVIIFNIGVPFVIMASVLLHFFGGLFWIMLGITGRVDLIDPLQLIIYISMFCGIFQAYQVYKLNFKGGSTPDKSIISE